jgi:hypothetical protein
MTLRLSAMLPDGAVVVSLREMRALVPVTMQGADGRAVEDSIAEDGAVMLATVFQDPAGQGQGAAAFVNRLALTSVMEVGTSWSAWPTMDMFVYEAQPESHRASRHDLFSWDGVYDAVELAKVEKRKAALGGGGRVPLFDKVSSGEKECGAVSASGTDHTVCKLTWGAGKGVKDEFVWAVAADL